MKPSSIHEQSILCIKQREEHSCLKIISQSWGSETDKDSQIDIPVRVNVYCTIDQVSAEIQSLNTRWPTI